MKYFLLISFFILQNSIYAQTKNDTISKKGNWLITNQFGNATLEAEDLFKINASTFEGLFGKEIYINKKISLITGIEFLRINGDYSTIDKEQINITNNHINIPIGVRFYKEKQNSISLFIEAGFYASYLLSSEIYEQTNNINSKSKKGGYNIGQHLTGGLRFKLSETITTNLGFKYKSDFYSAFKKNHPNFKILNSYAFQFGLEFNL